MTWLKSHSTGSRRNHFSYVCDEEDSIETKLTLRSSQKSAGSKGISLPGASQTRTQRIGSSWLLKLPNPIVWQTQYSFLRRCEEDRGTRFQKVKLCNLKVAAELSSPAHWYHYSCLSLPVPCKKIDIDATAYHWSLYEVGVRGDSPSSTPQIIKFLLVRWQTTNLFSQRRKYPDLTLTFPPLYCNR